MSHFTRRQFLGANAAAVALLAMARAGEALITLRAESRTIEVNGKAATMLQIGEPDGVWGFAGEVGTRFRVNLENYLDEPTLVHWLGLTPPYQQDRVPYISQLALAPGGGLQLRLSPRHSGYLLDALPPGISGAAPDGGAAHCP